MTTIKPPGGPGTIPPPPDTGPASGPRESGATAFQATLEETRGASKSGAPQAAAPVDAAGELVGELRAGKIDAAQLVDKLVEKALAASSPSLTPAGRAQLESVLRAALAEDPSLSAMVKDLERAR